MVHIYKVLTRQFNKYGGGIYMELDKDGNVVDEWRDPLGHHE